MNRSIFLSLVLNVSILSAKAQSFDSLTIMAYNILYYGEVTSFCTSTNNNIEAKDVNLETIAAYVDPDILVVNELGASNIYSNRILAKSLNTKGVEKYERVDIQNNSFSSIVNGYFYNKNKFGLYSRTSVKEDLSGNSIVRLIDVVRFYYRDPLLAAGSDTTFIDVLACHLKAGSTLSDETARGLAAEAVMDYLENRAEDAYVIVCGDMNLKNSSETAFQEFTSAAYGDFRFYDPIDESGSWNNNSAFSRIHTQSTRGANSSNGCFSGGGLDDRFDLILMSGQIMQDTGAVSYIPDSYFAIGNDGNHFNLDLNAGTNASVPSNVLTALYEMSDHLPVVADLKIKLLEKDVEPESITELGADQRIKIWQQGNELRIDNQLESMDFEMFNVSGSLVSEGSINSGYQSFALPAQTGIYLLQFNSSLGRIAKKLVVVR